MEESNKIEYVDLDLDVIMRNTGQWFLDDEDEFVENARSWRYPSAVVEEAQDAAAWLVEQAKALRLPFGFKRMEEVLNYYRGEDNKVSPKILLGLAEVGQS